MITNKKTKDEYGRSPCDFLHFGFSGIDKSTQIYTFNDIRVPLEGFSWQLASTLFKEYKVLPTKYNKKHFLNMPRDDPQLKPIYREIKFKLFNPDEITNHEIVLIVDMLRNPVSWNTVVSTIFKMQDFSLLVLRDAHNLKLSSLGLSTIPTREKFLTDDSVR